MSAVSTLGQLHLADQGGESAKPSLGTTRDYFDLADGVFRDGISALTLKNVEGLHLGFEEVIRDKVQDDPRKEGPHFSVHLRGKTVRQILDELCFSDARYTWSENGATINVYPRAVADDPTYLLNLWIDRMAVSAAPDPDQTLYPAFEDVP